MCDFQKIANLFSLSFCIENMYLFIEDI